MLQTKPGHLVLRNLRRITMAVGLSLLVVAGVAFAQARITTYKANEIAVHMDQWDPGTMANPGGNTHIRGLKCLYTRKALNGEALDPRVDGGTLTFTMNFNLDSNLSGPIWGTARWEIGDGIWEGTFQGQTNFATHVGHYKAVWHGTGAFSGLQLKESCVYTGTLDGTCTGRILQQPVQ